MSFEDIMELAEAGKMPTNLSPRTRSVVEGTFKMPQGIQEIYNRAINLEEEKESQRLGDNNNR